MGNKTEVDLINHPPHYKGYQEVECIDAIRAMLGKDSFEDYCRGNVIKYLWRCRHKDTKTSNIKKARWYINKMIENNEDN